MSNKRMSCRISASTGSACPLSLIGIIYIGQTFSWRKDMKQQSNKQNIHVAAKNVPRRKLQFLQNYLHILYSIIFPV